MNPKVQPLALGLLVLIALSTAANAKPRHGRPERREPEVHGDVSAGSEVFKTRCAGCHGKQAEGTAIGPGLQGVLGAKAASAPFAGYSAALKSSGLVWSPVKLDGFLAGPTKVVPGTAMMASVAKPEDRENLVAYLATLKK